MGANGHSPGLPAFKYEKRAHPRFTYDTTAFAEVANRRIAGEAATGFRIRTANAGEGGVMVTTDQPLSIGDLVRIVFTAQHEEPIELMAKVVWTRKNSVRLIGWYTAGLAFTPAGQAGVKRLGERARAATGPVAELVALEEER